MGICISYEPISAASTAKLIHHQDGRLEEFSNPVKVSQILKRNPKCFVCSSDDMDVNASLSGVDADDELELGELYFALPLTWLKNPLGPEQMAALAVKASLALEGCRRRGGCGMSYRRVDRLLFTANNKVVEYSSSTARADYGVGVGGYGGRGKHRGFGKLTAILEDV